MKLLERMFKAADTTKPFECFVLTSVEVHINKINSLRRKVGQPVWFVHCICFRGHDNSEILSLFHSSFVVKYLSKKGDNITVLLFVSISVFSEYLTKHYILILLPSQTLTWVKLVAVVEWLVCLTAKQKVTCLNLVNLASNLC